MTLVAIFLALVFLYSLVSRRLEGTILTAPMLFTTAGIVALLLLPELRHRQGSVEVLLRVAEIGLVLLLFTEATRTDRQALKSSRPLPARLLSTGLLLTILLGLLGALVVFRHLSVWEAGILAAILAPTDAGLGQVILSDSRVPARIRHALNAEAGLNDGLSVPFLLFFIALAGGGAGGHPSGLGRFVAQQLGLGVLLGVGIGLVGGWLLHLAQRNGWTADAFAQVGVGVLPLFCMLASDAIGASMFIAAFVAGLAFQVKSGDAAAHGVAFTESAAHLLNLSVFFLFGLLAARAWQQLSAEHWLYAALSLTVVRMAPVALALVGTRLSWPTVVFMGWFGPRGLASIVLGLVSATSGTHPPSEPTIRLAVMATVLCSIFAHGLSAGPGVSFYARAIAALGPRAPEHEGSRGVPLA